ncbi:MAG: sulfatase-like hydrolase/transferase [Clostridia bacterium]|nr:sulfatase-like hydrolase/transferase [Clostridia bacterium]
MKITFDKSLKKFPVFIAVIGVILAITLLIMRLNLVAIVNAAYLMITSALIFLGIIGKKKVYAPFFAGMGASLAGIIAYFSIWGADAGFGAFTSGLKGFVSQAHPLLTGDGNFFTRIAGNLLLALPLILISVLVILCAKKSKKFLSVLSGFVLVIFSVAFLLTMNLRSKPNTERLWEGHNDYLKGIDKNKTKKNSPNVLFIMMDDLGYGDISLNGSLIDTPNIDSIGKNGVELTNFYSSYSVCSPARFAALTGRYPYRGHADNVIYPTVNTISPFAATRLFNSVEMGANVDGMLGDEITLAEVFKEAGYNTGAFGKWHLGDYGEYLPTNQGFDYFYGSHHVNDMTPFYHVTEENGEWEIVHGTDEMKDQKNATKFIHEEITEWVTETVENSDEPFFAYYATPWPHAPIFVGDEFNGKTGLGTYADCVAEFDYYLGELFRTLEDLDVLDDTLIIFTSDNGPALQGSTNELRGGKYLAYEGGQKVPFLMRWDNGDAFKKGSSFDESATVVDLFPTLIEMCNITSEGKENVLPADREIDGTSMMPIFRKQTPVHTKENPILHMKREKLKSIQYAIPTEDVLKENPDYEYDVLKDNEYVQFKYFQNIQNDNSAFFDKFRKNWLHILTDDSGENYNRQTVYPSVAEEMNERMNEIMSSFKNNRRGIK